MLPQQWRTDALRERRSSSWASAGEKWRRLGVLCSVRRSSRGQGAEMSQYISLYFSMKTQERRNKKSRFDTELLSSAKTQHPRRNDGDALQGRGTSCLTVRRRKIKDNAKITLHMRFYANIHKQRRWWHDVDTSRPTQLQQEQARQRSSKESTQLQRGRQRRAQPLMTRHSNR